MPQPKYIPVIRIPLPSRPRVIPRPRGPVIKLPSPNQYDLPSYRFNASVNKTPKTASPTKKRPPKDVFCAFTILYKK